MVWALGAVYSRVPNILSISFEISDSNDNGGRENFSTVGAELGEAGVTGFRLF